MLQAKSGTGKLIVPALLSKAEIAQLRKAANFYCPECNEPVIIKAGPKTIPHFAHYSKKDCPTSAGGEGPYHEKGKLLLYQWLQKQKLPVALEKTITAIDRRPDLFIHLSRKKIALEYQCAKIASPIFLERNNDYQRDGIIPIWILGANQFKRKGKHVLQLDPFHTPFIHQFSASSPTMMFFFCPDSRQFALFQDIHPINNNRFFGSLHFKHLEEMHFKDIFSNDKLQQNQFRQILFREKEAFRRRRRANSFGKERAWLQWLYLKGIHVEHLPSAIFLPVPGQFLMKTQPWNWQSRICMDVIDQLPIGGTFTIRTCHMLLRDHFHSPQSFPLLRSVPQPIKCYLELLARLSIIKEVSPDHYVKMKQLQFYRHIDDAIRGDYQLVHHLEIGGPSTKKECFAKD